MKGDQLRTLDNELAKSKKECETLRSKIEQLESELFEMAEKSQEVKAEEIEDLRGKLKGELSAKKGKKYDHRPS